MATIRVTPEELKGYGDEVKNMAENLNDILTQLDGKITVICDSWDGLAQDAFLASYESMKETLRQFPQIVDAIGSQTVAAAETFGSVDSELSSSFAQ